MNKTKDTQTERPKLVSLFDKILLLLESEISALPDTIQAVSPEKRLDFVSKNLPLLLKYRETGQGDSWTIKWGD